MAKLSDRILGERVSGYVTKPNLLDNSNFQIHQRGLSNASGSGGTFFDRYVTRGIGSTGGATALSLLRSSAAAIASPRYLAVAATGHTSFWYLRQNFRVSQITEGSDYTFSFSTNLMDSPIKLKAKLQGRDVSAGAWAELGEADIAVDSNGEYSVTFLNVTSTLPLNGDAGDYIQIEEGNVFTGYEPTPYAIDEAECMKWFYSRPSAIVALPIYNSTANLTRYAQITFPAPMYFTPATFAQTLGSGYSGGVTQNSIGTHGYQIRGAASGPVSATFLTDVTASCEL